MSPFAFPARAVLPGLILLAGLTACQDVSVTIVPVDRVVIEPDAVSMQVDSTRKLTATLVSDDGRPLPGREVVWTSLNPAVAEVDGTGLVRGLGPGTATIRATSEGASGEASVTVTIGPVISATPTQVEFTTAQNGASPGDRTIAITNAGTGVLNRLARAVRYTSGQPTGWLSANLAGTTAPTTLVLTATPGAMPAGTYEAFVDITSGATDNTVTVAVQLTVTARTTPAAISLSSASFSFAATTGGSNPGEQALTITNVGGGTLSGLSATVEYTSAQTGWLTATLSGTTAPATLTLRATTGSLPPGSHTARVLVASPAAENSPQQVTVTFNVGQIPAPGAPSGLTATPVGITRIDLAWSAASGAVERYRIQRRLSSGSGSGSFAVIDSVPAGTTTYQDAGLLAITGYTYRVQACGPGGCSDWSNEASASTLPEGPPSVPTDVTATRLSSTQVQLTWTAPGGQTNYEIRRRTGTGGPWTFSATAPGDATSWLDSGLTPQTTYQYQIRACSSAGCSDYSATATVSTSPSGNAEGG